MRGILTVGIAAIAAALILLPKAHAASIDDYGSLPSLSDVTLSPSGKSIAYVDSSETKRYVVIQSVGNPKPLAAINMRDAKLRAIQWADDTRLLLITSTTAHPMGLIGRRDEWAMAQYYDVKTNTSHALLQNLDEPGGRRDNPETMNVIAGDPEPRIIDGRTYVFVPGIYFPGRQSRLALFRVDLSYNSPRIVSNKNDSRAEDWTIDSAGNIVAQTDYLENEQRWKLKLYRDGDATTAIDVTAPIEGPSVEGLSEDGTHLIVRLPATEDKPTYEEISLKDGSTSPWKHADADLDGLMVDESTGRIIGGPRFTDRSDYVFFDPHADKVWRSIKAAFRSAANVNLVSWSSDWTKVIVRVFGADYGDGYFYVDMTTRKADPIGPAYRGIENVAPVKWIDYKAADGRDIHAYLTLPLGTPANGTPKNLPLIVLPHGGPHARDEPGFDWISQALASRGYAVLQPEFRGSDGFGKDLLWAGFGEFGRKMQTDLSDGVRALAAQGLIDPKRVCIVGASYGGYAALAGATLDTGVYRCAVSIAGLSDLRQQLRYWHWPRSTLDDRSERFWDRFLAVKDLDDPKLDAISPIKHVDKVTIPILLIHGRDDTVVPISQSEDMADALRRAGKSVEFVKLDGEDHWLSRGATRRQMLEATVKFLEANNPPGTPAQAASVR